MKRQKLLVALLFFGLAGWTRADDQPVKVPFDTLQTQHIVIMIKINGKGPYRVIFDTGAPYTLINTKIAVDSVVVKNAKMAAGGMFNTKPFNMKSLEVGGVKVDDMPAMVMDHPTVTAIDKAVGPVEGIVGLSFFGRYRLTIDYQAKEMTFVPVKFTPPDTVAKLMALLSPDTAGEKKVLAPAAQWGFSVTKDAGDDDAGVVVKTVLEGSPVAKAGLKAGDRLLTLEGRWTDSVADCYLAASYVRPGSEARLVILREGKEMELKVRVQAGL
jgi:hypothetical protein